jgi:hypothetical protein
LKCSRYIIADSGEPLSSFPEGLLAIRFSYPTGRESAMLPASNMSAVPKGILMVNRNQTGAAGFLRQLHIAIPR